MKPTPESRSCTRGGRGGSRAAPEREREENQNRDFSSPSPDGRKNNCISVWKKIFFWKKWYFKFFSQKHNFIFKIFLKMCVIVFKNSEKNQYLNF